MRAIKFRAWDKAKQKFVWFELCKDGLSFKWSENEIYESGGFHFLPHNVAMEVNSDWMQFTGLLDKHGKPIYEGDIIVEVVTQHGTGKRLEFKKRGVEIGPFYFSDYEDGCAGYGFMIETCSLDDIKEKYEVIGNIYENPELLSAPTKE